MELLYFILGILYITVIQPMFSSILELFMTWLEAKKIPSNENMQLSNIKIQKALTELEREDTRAIGFTADWEEETCEDEEVL